MFGHLNYPIKPMKIAIRTRCWGWWIAGICLFSGPALWAKALDGRPGTTPRIKPVLQPVVAPATVRKPATTTRSLTGERTPPDALVFDANMKELTADENATNILVTFNFTNVHTSDVTIKLVRPSCGCTTVKLPPLPWVIKPGQSEKISASLDLKGKRGILTKSLTVDSSSGYKSLLFKVTIPVKLTTETADGLQIDSDRLNNMKMATVDRQVVFKNKDCAKCHVEPGHGKKGEDLYRASCAICHDTPHRATMVPDLTALKFPTSGPYWKYWIMNGRPGSLMPAFAESHGGPLDKDQIDSLVDYLTETISRKTNPNASVQGPIRNVPPGVRKRPSVTIPPTAAPRPKLTNEGD
jgi:hypothetical protein